MKFIDEALIEVWGGDGGDGCVSFRREKYVPRGGPDGGKGGDGGSCFIKAKAGLSTLMDVKYQREFRAQRGAHGQGKNRYGRKGEDRIIVVPQGTLVKDKKTGEILGDLTKDGETLLVAKGGKGGLGNTHFATATRQAPRLAKRGGKGEHRPIYLELKLLADVGLIGFPNVGKSTLISALSNAKPKIADYPFTTKIPNLGVVRLGFDSSFVVADLPGLIEGAHRGAGMGIQFLKHMERTRVFLHLIDITDETRKDPRLAYKTLREEMSAYQELLLKKPEIIVLTKMDLPDARRKQKKMETLFQKMGKNVLSISAVQREGLKPLLHQVSQLLAKTV